MSYNIHMHPLDSLAVWNCGLLKTLNLLIKLHDLFIFFFYVASKIRFEWADIIYESQRLDIFNGP